MKYHIYCDESTLNGRYAVYGGFIMHNNSVNKVEQTIYNIKQKNNLFSEIKWSKISNQYYDKYLNLIDSTSSLLNKNVVHFRSVIIDNNALNNRKYNDGNKELGIYKFYYQLLYNCFIKYQKNSSFDIYIDKRSTNYDFQNLTDILNNKSRAKNNTINCVKQVDSKKSNIIQLNDLLLGALSFHKNKTHEISGTKQSKIDIANFISDKIAGGEKIMGSDTPMSQGRFKVWNMRMSR